MSSIPDTMKIIAQDIKNTFEELMKLLLRKTLRPMLNPLSSNKVVYNSFLRKYERGLINTDDNICKYSYVMTHDCLGWTDDNVTNFRVLAKYIKNNNLARFPLGYAKIHNTLLIRNRVAYSERDKNISISNSIFKPQPYSCYKNFIEFLAVRNIQNIISNKKAAFAYTCDIPYSECYKQLESIGKDIINQTDPNISASESARLSTAMLRVKLYNLEQDLTNLHINHPNIYVAYIKMVKIINSVARNKMIWVINLLALLSYKNWSDLTNQQQQNYINALSNNFILEFNSNELITILLQSKHAEFIIKCSYLYSLLKMLFIVFGYSELTPIIETKQNNDFKKHFEKYIGASLRRGQNNTSQETQLINVNYEPIDKCKYEYIKLFGHIYPMIINILGGTEIFPPEQLIINCNNIPQNYNNLTTISEFLWRFNDFSYCKYINYVGSKQINNITKAKINKKTKYLKML